MFNVSFPNIASLLAVFENITKEIMSKGIEQIAQQARDLAKLKAPHLTGALKRSIYMNKVNDYTFAVGSPLSYAWAVEFGSGIYGTGPGASGDPIRPKQGSFLTFQIGGQWVRVKYVLGQRPQPFLRPACEEAIANADIQIKATGVT